MSCPKRDAGDRKCLFKLSFGPPEMCLLRKGPGTPGDRHGRILEEARKTVSPIIERERLNEVVTSDMMDFLMR